MKFLRNPAWLGVLVGVLAIAVSLALYLKARFAVVFAEPCNRLEAGHQSPGQPHQFNVALGFLLKASAGLNAVEVTVNIDLQEHRGVISRPNRVDW